MSQRIQIRSNARSPSFKKMSQRLISKNNSLRLKRMSPSKMLVKIIKWMMPRRTTRICQNWTYNPRQRLSKLKRRKMRNQMPNNWKTRSQASSVANIGSSRLFLRRFVWVMLSIFMQRTCRKRASWPPLMWAQFRSWAQ